MVVNNLDIVLHEDQMQWGQFLLHSMKDCLYALDS